MNDEGGASTSPKRGSLEFFAAQTPDSPALAEGLRALTWRQWNDQANQLAGALEAALELGPGDRVGVRLHNCLEWYVVNAALAKLGATFISIGWRLTAGEVHYIIADSGASAFLFDDEEPQAFVAAWAEAGQDFAQTRPISLQPTARADILAYADLLAAPATAKRYSAGPAANLLYTSGTTGRQKGILRGSGQSPERRAARGLTGRDLIATLGLGPDDRHLVCAPLYHGAAPAMARLTHVLGGAVHIMRKFAAEDTLRLVAELGITTTFMVPTMLRRIVNLPLAVRRSYDVSSLRCILTGATAVPFGLKQQVIEHFGNRCLFESYGSTEVGLATIMVPDEQLRRPGSCGRLLAGVSARILDPDGAEVPCGQLGEIYIAGPELIGNYLNQGPHGEDVAKQGYFSAGDIGRLDGDGFLYIVDRKNDMIISGGVNIHPSEIEAVLGQHPAVLEAAVFGIPNPDFGEEVKAVCEVVPGQAVSADELLAFARDRLADYKRPRSIDFVEQLPRNPAEKVLKRELRQPYWNQAAKET